MALRPVVPPAWRVTERSWFGIEEFAAPSRSLDRQGKER